MYQDHFSRFDALHHQAQPLFLANAWDAASARLLEHLGAAAVATSSAGLAWSCGYADGSVLPRNKLLNSLRRIRRAIALPLSADIEDGYSDDPREVADLVLELVAAGVVGINLEDGEHSPDLLCEKIRVIRAALGETHFFINARCDVYLHQLYPAGQCLSESLTRMRAYQDAGASGLFLPAVVTESDIQAAVAATTLPLNVLAIPGLPPAERLQSLGVKRVSAGSGSFLSAFTQARDYMGEFLTGQWPQRPPQMLNYSEVNALFENSAASEELES